MRRLVQTFDDRRPLRPRAMPVAPETLCQTARDTYPPHFSRLSLRAFVNDAASRAQVDVESAAHDRHRFSPYPGKSRARKFHVRSPAQPPSTHPNLTSCVCRSLSRRRRRSLLPEKPVLLSTSRAQIIPACARACALFFSRRARRRRGGDDIRRRRRVSAAAAAAAQHVEPTAAAAELDPVMCCYAPMSNVPGP